MYLNALGNLEIVIWEDGTQTRSFMFIEDRVKGMDLITHYDDLIATPINLSTSELISVSGPVSMIEHFANVRLMRIHDLDKPRGVAGRTSDSILAVFRRWRC
jgi:GDP-D-mannose 3',5'-epimerase